MDKQKPERQVEYKLDWIDRDVEKEIFTDVCRWFQIYTYLRTSSHHQTSRTAHPLPGTSQAFGRGQGTGPSPSKGTWWPQPVALLMTFDGRNSNPKKDKAFVAHNIAIHSIYWTLSSGTSTARIEHPGISTFKMLLARRRWWKCPLSWVWERMVFPCVGR